MEYMKSSITGKPITNIKDLKAFANGEHVNMEEYINQLEKQNKDLKLENIELKANMKMYKNLNYSSIDKLEELKRKIMELLEDE